MDESARAELRKADAAETFRRWRIEMRLLRHKFDQTASMLPKESPEISSLYFELASKSMEDAAGYMLLLSESLR